MKRNGFLILCALMSSQFALAADMGNYGLKYLSADFAAPVVYDRTAINAPQAGSIVYDTGSTAFYGLPSGANPSSGWVLLSSPSGGSFFASTQVSTASSTITSSGFTSFGSSTLSFVPPLTGTYKIYASVAVSSTGTGAVKIENTVGGATLLAESQAAMSFTSNTASVYVQSVYTLSAGTTYTFDLQGAEVSGAQQLRGDLAPFYIFAEFIH